MFTENIFNCYKYVATIMYRIFNIFLGPDLESCLLSLKQEVGSRGNAWYLKNSLLFKTVKLTVLGVQLDKGQML